MIQSTTQRRAFLYKPYKELTYLEKFLLTLEMINIFTFVSLESLGYCIRYIFGNANPKELKRILSILAGAQYIQASDSFFSLVPRKQSLLEFEGVQIENTKARILDYYTRYNPTLYNRFRRGLGC